MHHPATATINRWRRQARIDAGVINGVDIAMASELAVAKRRSRQVPSPNSTRDEADSLKESGRVILGEFGSLSGARKLETIGIGASSHWGLPALSVIFSE